MEKEPILRASGLTKTFEGTEGRIEVLKGLDLEVFEGEVVAILGASGVGKSTLLHILGTLDRPDSGKVEVKGRDVFEMDSGALSRLRNEVIGFVFQFHHLLPDFTALENVMMPSLIGGGDMRPARENALRLLDAVGLSGRAHHKPGELSGGEQQRVAVARAFANEPDIILADEPTGNLDEKASGELNELVLELSRKEQRTFVVVTHKKGFAGLATRAFLLEGGGLNSFRGNNVGTL
jgi:lipoprotein-releasing system ATP-binding protein